MNESLDELCSSQRSFPEERMTKDSYPNTSLISRYITRTPINYSFPASVERKVQPDRRRCDLRPVRKGTVNRCDERTPGFVEARGSQGRIISG